MSEAGEVPVAKNAEVAAAVGVALGVLRAAGAKFREYEVHHGREASLSDPGSAVQGDRLTKASINRSMALNCEEAAEGLAASIEAAFTTAMDVPKIREPLSPSALFRAGFEYGERAGRYAEIPEDAREVRWGDKAVPPSSHDQAWSIVRAILAKGGK